MSEHKPGTVARVTLVNERTGDTEVYPLAFWDAFNEQWVSSDRGRLHPDGPWVVKVDPLVVLDLAPGDEVEIAALFRREAKFPDARLLGYADQIEAQTKPPRITEPGLWGVVAHDGRNYVHTTLFDWRSGDYVVDWADIKDGATLVRPGIDD